MSHRTETVVSHWIDLDESEQFEVANSYRKKPYRAVSVYAEVIDGLLSSVRLTIYPVLKDGSLGKVNSQYSCWRPEDNWMKAATILRARGVPFSVLS